MKLIAGHGDWNASHGIGPADLPGMSTMVAVQIRNFSRGIGHNWKKVLILAVLGMALGVALAIAIPLRVS